MLVEKEILMRYPLWILNSSLLLFCLISLGFIFFSRQRVPSRQELEPETIARPVQEDISKINISKIYENDLFNTFKKPPLESKEIEVDTALPAPPTPKQVIVPKTPTAQFLDPINISLKGIIIVVNDTGKSRAIISDNKTNKEATYRVGDSIEDAQLIRIVSNKIIFLRSNGQQEVLYLREKDAQLDPIYSMVDDWEGVIEKMADGEFVISVRKFLFRINNLAQFIDTLDLTTVYQKGKSIGCRIGHTENSTLAKHLGLQTGDIITAVNDTPAIDTASRFKIYKNIIGLHTKDSITVVLSRNNTPQTLTYTIHDMLLPKQKKKEKGKPAPITIITPQEIKKEKLKTLEQKRKFAPTLKEIRSLERRNMLLHGKSPLRAGTHKGSELKNEK